jgi:hypothetical protein
MQLTRRLLPLLLFTGFLLPHCLLQAQDGAAGTAKPEKLFAGEDTMTVVMSAPWRELESNKRFQGTYPATIEFTDSLGHKQTLEMTVERRGITRQRVCRYPPIKLRFEKAAVKGTAFRGQKSLKLVTHCEKATRFEQYYVMEMLIYRLYNQVTDRSFRVRPLNVTYVDSEKGDSDDDRFGFLIEDDSDVAKRNGVKKLNIPKISPTRLDADLASEFTLFQFLVGNLDWSFISGPKPNECCHNAKLIGPEPLQAGDVASPVPYDFDSAGLVDAHYAAPPGGLPVNSVTQRLFRGFCLHNDTLPQAREKLLALEQDFYATLEEESRLNGGVRKRGLKYLKSGFERIRDPDDWQGDIIGRCRK